MPDWTKKGEMGHIKEIISGDEVNWKETASCAGFNVSDDCPWRYNEMELLSYTPPECLEHPELNCANLVSYARFEMQKA